MGLTPMASALQRTGITQVAFARMIGAGQRVVAGWCIGEFQPQPDILAWVEALANAIEKHPPPAWRSGRGSRSGNRTCGPVRKGGNPRGKNGRDARGDSAPAIRVTPKVGAGAKHDLRPAERGRRMETRAPGPCDIGA